MDVTEAQLIEAVRDLMRHEARADIVGAGSLLKNLPAPEDRVELRLDDHHGIVRHEPSDLTVTVRAGTHVEALASELADSGQECPIEGVGTTVGGRIASGLSGLRRLGTGPLRQWILGARVVTADGQALRIGSGTVKNVTGYDLPRLLCGSWGTLAILTEVTLRVRPLPRFSQWYFTEEPNFSLVRLYRPVSVLRTRRGSWVLLEGHPDDCTAQARACGLKEDEKPVIPATVRFALPPERILELLGRLDGEYAAEAGVGVVHADPPPTALPVLREYAQLTGGRMLALDAGAREEAGITAFGNGGSAPHFTTRIRSAVDPRGILSPWRFST